MRVTINGTKLTPRKVRKMSNLDKELEKILEEGVRKVFTLVQFSESQSSIDANIIAQTGNITQMQSFLGRNIGKQSITKIKQTILKELKKNKPKNSEHPIEARIDTDIEHGIHIGEVEGYNAALSDFEAVLDKVLGGKE